MCASVRVFVRFYIELSSARQSSSWAGKTELERSLRALSLTAAHIRRESKLQAVHSSARGAKK